MVVVGRTAHMGQLGLAEDIQNRLVAGRHMDLAESRPN